MDKYKEFDYIRKIINSCETYVQLRTPVTRLITLFHNKYSDFMLTALLHNCREDHKLK